MNIDEKLEKIQEGTLEIVDIESNYNPWDLKSKYFLQITMLFSMEKDSLTRLKKPQNTIKNASKLWGSLKIPNTYSVLNSRLKEDTLSNTPTMFTSWLL